MRMEIWYEDRTKAVLDKPSDDSWMEYLDA